MASDMQLVIEERLSDSPLVERIWRSQSERGGLFTSVAFSQWELVFWTQYGRTYLTVRGPETKATVAPVPAEADSFGIVFKHGTFLPLLPVSQLVNDGVTLPGAASHSFWLHGAAWQFPTYDNAETFIDRLVRQGTLVCEPIVAATIQGQPPDLSPRTLQRHIIRATGLTQTAIYQIERARQAAILLKEGMPILDTVEAVGYADQSHLTRSLKHLIGQTPAQLVDIRRSEQLSFLFKTSNLW